MSRLNPRQPISPGVEFDAFPQGVRHDRNNSIVAEAAGELVVEANVRGNKLLNVGEDIAPRRQVILIGLVGELHDAL